MKLLTKILNPVYLFIKKKITGSSGNGDKLASMLRNEAQEPSA